MSQRGLSSRTLHSLRRSGLHWQSQASKLWKRFESLREAAIQDVLSRRVPGLMWPKWWVVGGVGRPSCASCCRPAWRENSAAKRRLPPQRQPSFLGRSGSFRNRTPAAPRQVRQGCEHCSSWSIRQKLPHKEQTSNFSSPGSEMDQFRFFPTSIPLVWDTGLAMTSPPRLI